MQNPIRFDLLYGRLPGSWAGGDALAGDEHCIGVHACPTAIRIFICAAFSRLLGVCSGRRGATAELMVPWGLVAVFPTAICLPPLRTVLPDGPSRINVGCI